MSLTSAKFTAEHDAGASNQQEVQASCAQAADARLIATLDALLVAMHAAGRDAVSVLDTSGGTNDVLLSLATRAIGFRAVDIVGMRGCAASDPIAAALSR